MCVDFLPEIGHTAVEVHVVYLYPEGTHIKVAIDQSAFNLKKFIGRLVYHRKGSSF